MHVDLLRVQTSDWVFLEGILQRPPAPAAPLPDAVLCIHGTGGNFYGSALFDFLAEKFLSAGVAMLRANTRGHDVISNASTTKGGQRLGAAYEVVDDCRHDLHAWTTWLHDNVGPRVLLLGHSLGAVKCLYAAAHAPDLLPSPGISAALPGIPPRIIALSPPRLSYEWFCSSPKRDAFLADYRRAEENVDKNEPLALLDVQMPLPFVITAAGYLEKYGPDERYNFLKLLLSIRTPTLFLFGGIEVANNVAFQDAPPLIEEQKKRYPHLNVHVIPGGDHFYSGVRDAAWAVIEAALGCATLEGWK
jgi:pimeloyl-ACP methyl ester carboxylesterase